MKVTDNPAMRAVQTALRVIYPARCLSCGGLVESDFGLCGPCWTDTPFIIGTVCDSCGCPLPGQQERAVRCDDCLASPPPWARGRAALLYHGMGRRLVMGLKHGDRHEIAAPAADWMVEGAGDTLHADMLVVPVPLHWRRRVRRGFNQSALLSRAIARRLGASDGADVLLRPRATPSLDHRGRAERLQIMTGAIAVNRRREGLLAGRSVLLVDDVMTTGATLSAAARACMAAGATDVTVLVLARVAKAP